LPAQFILAFCKSKQRERTTNNDAKVASFFVSHRTGRKKTSILFADFSCEVSEHHTQNIHPSLPTNERAKKKK